MNLKVCIKCGKKKSIMEFGKHPHNDDGYQIWCYGCQANYQKDLYQKHAEDKRAQVAARRDKVGRLLDKIKATNPCRCGEDEPLCLSLYPLAEGVPKVTKNSGLKNVRKALAGSAVICANCRVKVDAGLLDAPQEPLSWRPLDLEPLEPKPVEGSQAPSRKEKPRPASPAPPPGVSLEPGTRQ